MSVFETLNRINVNEHTEKKGNLTYLSWAWAWAEVKKAYPGAFYTIYENRDGLNYHTDGKTAWVKTGVTVGGLEHIEYLPVMDFKNNSIPLERITSTDVNKAIQRSLTKACARHGLGLYIYAGEDLPEDAPVQEKEQADKEATPDSSSPEPRYITETQQEEIKLLAREKWGAQAGARFKAAFGYKNMADIPAESFESILTGIRFASSEEDSECR